MALMLSALYEALLEAGASEEKARKAAEEAAQYEGRLASLDGRLGMLQWTLGIGFSVMVALHLMSLNWLWQVLQRLPVRP